MMKVAIALCNLKYKDQIWSLMTVQSCFSTSPGKCCLPGLHLRACLRKDRSLKETVCRKVSETVKKNC